MDISKKRWFRTGTALICSVAITLSVLPAFADGDIESLENQTSALENELAGINQDILDLNDKITATEMQVEILQGEIERTTDNLAAAEENEQQQYEDMKTRIKYMYENGSLSLLEMLFSAKDMADFLNKADFIEHLSRYDRNALNELQEIHQSIADQKSALEEQQDSMEELQADMQSQKAELQATAKETATNLDDVNARLKKAKEEEARRLAEEEAAREAAAAGSAVSGSGSSGSGSSGSGSSGSGSSGSGSSGSGSSVSGGTTTGGTIDASVDEITLMAALLDCEAIHDYTSMLAVATVIMNRVEDPRFPNTIRGVIYAKGQFEPTWTGRLDSALNRGPTQLARQVTEDAVNGKRLAAVSHCYFFLYAPSTNRDGITIGDNTFFQSW